MVDLVTQQNIIVKLRESVSKGRLLTGYLFKGYWKVKCKGRYLKWKANRPADSTWLTCGDDGQAAGAEQVGAGGDLRSRLCLRHPEGEEGGQDHDAQRHVHLQTNPSSCGETYWGPHIPHVPGYLEDVESYLSGEVQLEKQLGRGPILGSLGGADNPIYHRVLRQPELRILGS